MNSLPIPPTNLFEFRQRITDFTLTLTCMILSLRIASVCQEKGGIFSVLYLGSTTVKCSRKCSNFKCLRGKLFPRYMGCTGLL